MPNLSDLVKVLSRVSGVPEATVFAYGRFARQARAIAQKGRGLAAASMCAQDAANLLIAVAGTPITKEAGAAVKTFRPLRGHILTVLPDSLDEIFLDWLRPLGLKPREEEGLSFQELQITFGSFIEFLIGQCASGDLLRFFQQLDAAEGGLGEAHQIKVGPIESFWLSVVFDRTASTAEVLIRKKDPENNKDRVFSVFFRRSTPRQKRGDLSENVTFGLNSIAALAAALDDRAIPNLQSVERYSDFFFSLLDSDVRPSPPKRGP